tara:strand:+ start:86414 stop:86719 length:306 start_codon:yes stop_codon:yes gene_type:complete
MPTQLYFCPHFLPLCAEVWVHYKLLLIGKNIWDAKKYDLMTNPNIIYSANLIPARGLVPQKDQLRIAVKTGFTLHFWASAQKKGAPKSALFVTDLDCEVHC